MTPLPRIRTFTLRQTPAASRSPLQEGTPQRREQLSGHPLDGVAEDRDDIVDVALLDDERGRQRKGVAAHAEVQPAIEAVDHDVVATRTDRTVTRRQLDRAHQAAIADVDDVGQALQ